MKSYRNIGISLLLVVFLVLCLTIFATLSLSTSQGDYNLTQNQAKRDQEYYAAGNIAEEELARIDDALANIRTEMLESKSSALDSASLSDKLSRQGLFCTTETVPEDDSILIDTNAAFSGSEINNNSDINMTVTDNDGIFHINYSVRINDNQALYVGLTITDAITNPNSQEDHYYDINTWQVKNDK